MRIRIFTLGLVTTLFMALQPPGAFRQEQLKFSRVREAFNEEEKDLLRVLKANGIDAKNLEIFIRAFKDEAVLEVWYRKKGTQKFTGSILFDICVSSGDPGPKRRAGDGQVPEGFYSIDRFNPVSNYYLSLGVNYPNASDKLLGVKGSLGGDIFIHGSCVSIGCMPLQNYIKQVYVLAVMARNAGQKNIPVHIFPFRMTGANSQRFSQEYPRHRNFWAGLKPGYDYFETHHQLPQVTINDRGAYIFNR